MPPAGDTQHPATDIDETRVAWVDGGKNTHEGTASPRLLDSELYRAAPIRSGNRYRNQRNYHGWHWVAGTKEQVWYESLFERQALLFIDFSFDLSVIATQPMRLTFDNGAKHFPDFMALHTDDRQVLYDVKPQKFIGAAENEQFARTKAVCDAIGWDYLVFSGLSQEADTNLHWLANYRQPQFAPAADLRAFILDAFAEPATLGSAVTAAASAEVAGVIAGIHHMAWHGDLTFDLGATIAPSTIFTKGPHA